MPRAESPFQIPQLPRIDERYAKSDREFTFEQSLQHVRMAYIRDLKDLELRCKSWKLPISNQLDVFPRPSSADTTGLKQTPRGDGADNLYDYHLNLAVIEEQASVNYIEERDSVHSGIWSPDEQRGRATSGLGTTSMGLRSTEKTSQSGDIGVASFAIASVPSDAQEPCNDLARFVRPKVRVSIEAGKQRVRSQSQNSKPQVTTKYGEDGHHGKSSTSHKSSKSSVLENRSRAVNKEGSDNGPGVQNMFTLNGHWNVLEASSCKAQLLKAASSARLGSGSKLAVGKKPSSRSRVGSVFDQEVGLMPITNPMRFFLFSPDGIPRLIWDVLGVLVFLICDLVLIPLEAFDEIKENGVVRVFNWVSPLFWTIDILANFVTGYHDDHLVVMSYCLIAKHYLRSWFVVDFAILAVEWTSTIIALGGSSFASFGSLLRILRFARLVRLIRILKLSKVMRDVRDMLSGDSTSVVLDILNVIFFLVMLNHGIACLFYLVGKASTEEGTKSWLDELPYTTTAFKYISAMHWSLTQFTPASTDINPMNTFERFFNVGVLICGLVIFSGLISSITSSLMQLRQRRADDMKQFYLLRRFLNERGVPLLLSSRIHKYLEHVLARRGRHVQEDSIKILGLLSDGLQNELQYCIKTSHILVHPLFDTISSRAEAAMHRLASIMERAAMAQDDCLFYQGEPAVAMYFVVTGDLTYAPDSDADLYSEAGSSEHIDDDVYDASARAVLLIQPHDWVCEAALWTFWVHLGDLYANVDCEILTLDADSFVDLMKANPHICQMVVHYARMYMAQLNDLYDRKEYSTLETHITLERDDDSTSRINYGYLEMVLRSQRLSQPIPSWAEFKNERSKTTEGGRHKHFLQRILG